VDTKEKPTPRTKIVEPPITGDEKMVYDPFKKKEKNPKVKMKSGGMYKMKKGGMVKKGNRGDGCCSKGKTRGKMC
jgi:hypothetical protein